MKVLFLGSSRFSLIVLKKMLEERVNIIGVITQPDKPSGRGHKLTPSEVKVYALENGIKVYDFENGGVSVARNGGLEIATRLLA